MVLSVWKISFNSFFKPFFFSGKQTNLSNPVITICPLSHFLLFVKERRKLKESVILSRGVTKASNVYGPINPKSMTLGLDRYHSVYSSTFLLLIWTSGAVIEIQAVLHSRVAHRFVVRVAALGIQQRDSERVITERRVMEQK